MGPMGNDGYDVTLGTDPTVTFWVLRHHLTQGQAHKRDRSGCEVF